MKCYVITLMDMPESVAASHRCMESAEAHGVEAYPMAAWTPADDPEMRMAMRGFATAGFDQNLHSRRKPCLAAFLSHASLWHRCLDGNEPLVVLEHDAVFVAPLPDLSAVTHLCNLGRPSFGDYDTPRDGLGPFVSKSSGYLGGAHAYYLTPAGARGLLSKATLEAQPTDVFLRTQRFPWMQEYHPWPVVCEDDFTTIQLPLGCKAKHRAVEILGPG